jgi:hypothetical protein
MFTFATVLGAPVSARLTAPGKWEGFGGRGNQGEGRSAA